MATGVTFGTSGGNKTLTAAYVGTSGGNKIVTEVYVGTPAGNKLVFANLTVIASPDTIFATASGSGSATTGPAFVTIEGGVGPFVRSWFFQTGGAGLTIDTPTGSSTRVSGSPGAGNTLNGQLACQVTDQGTGLVVISDTVGASISGDPV